MNSKLQKRLLLCVVIVCCQLPLSSLFAQNEHDAIMMNKYQWCNGISYMHSQWSNYWEGTFSRKNANLGTVTTQSTMVMSNYGITDNLNIIAGIPYVTTNASQGTLHGMKGFQDASLYVKWRPLALKTSAGKISLFAIGGISTPSTNYEPDFLPMSIGLGSTNLTGRVMADYQKGIFFTTVSAAYVRRSNVKLDRTSYYTTEIHSSNEVQMPDAAMYNFSMGIRKKYLVLEALLYNSTTLGGFDIRKNDMPFASNKMNATSVGMHAKYTLPFFTHVELTGDAAYVVAGRNVGQAFSYSAGGYYIFSFKQKKNAFK